MSLKKLQKQIQFYVSRYSNGKCPKWYTTLMIAGSLDTFREQLKPYIDGTEQTMPVELMNILSLITSVGLEFDTVKKILITQQVFALERLKKKGYDTTQLENTIKGKNEKI